jgi:hypothetical protein
VAEAGVDDGGDIAGSGQVPFGDRIGQDTGGVQAGQFGGAQRPPQPLRLVARWPAVAGRQRAHEQGVVGDCNFDGSVALSVVTVRDLS